VQLKGAAVVGQSNIDVEHHHELIRKKQFQWASVPVFFWLSLEDHPMHGW